MLYQVRLVFGIGSRALLTGYMVPWVVAPTTTLPVDATVLRDLQNHRSLDDNAMHRPNLGDQP